MLVKFHKLLFVDRRIMVIFQNEKLIAEARKKFEKQLGRAGNTITINS